MTVYTDDTRPPRRRDESPVQYLKRTGKVDARYWHKHKGWYYCNPAHCGLRWKDKAKRDAHFNLAYAALS